MHMIDQKHAISKREQEKQDSRSMGLLVLVFVIYLLAESTVNQIF